MRSKVIILGGGTAGLCLAISLRYFGIEVKVYEKRPQPGDAGAGIIIAPNALQALEPFGITDQIIHAGYGRDGIQTLTHKGKKIIKMSVQDGSYKLYSIHRGDLNNLLYEALPPSTVEYGKECVGINQDEHGVRIQFRDGSDATGDILVAADGIHSIVRKQLSNKNSYRFAGYTCWRGIVSSDSCIGLSEEFIETWGPQGRFGIIPLPNSQVYWYAMVNALENDDRFRSYTVTDLANHFEKYHDPIPSLLKSSHKMIHRDIVDIIPMDRFYSNRTLFIGDAAHAFTPNLGQGACQAIEDAVVAAECISRHTDYRQAFAEFDSRRRTKIETISKRSWMFGKITQLEHPMAIAVRNLLLQHTPKQMYQHGMHQLYKFQG